MQDKTKLQYPEEIIPRNTKDISSDEINIKDIIRQLWIKRKFILITTSLFLLLGIFVAIFSPVQYTAESTILPQSGKPSSAGNLSSLASIVGVNMGTAVISEGTLSTIMYPKIINSLPFAREIMQTTINSEKSNGQEITLYEYYTDKKYKDVNILAVVKKYTIGLPRTLLSVFRRSKTAQQSISSNTSTTSDSLGIVKITAQELAVYNNIKNSIQYEYNAKEGIIKLGYTFPEAIAAAQISEQLAKSLEEYVVNYKTEKVKENLEFVQQSYMEAKKDFFQKQADLAAFQDANRGIITATGRATETRLRSEYDIAFTIYNELARQLEQAKLSVKEEKPVLTVLNPVIVPLGKSAPQTEKIITIYLLLGVVVSCVWIFIAPFFKEIIATKSYKNNN